MAAKRDTLKMEDTDGSKMIVYRTSTQILVDTDPDSHGIDSMVALDRDQVRELIKFLRSDG